jgi:putative transposase
VRTICHLLGVSPSGYYAWNRRSRSQRAQGDELLLVAIRAIHRRSQGTYGAPRIHAELAASGKQVGRKRVARLMREAGLAGVSRRRRFTTTVRQPGRRPAPDLVTRNFTALQGNQLWVADITYIPTATGFLYLSVVLDVWSRRIVGWSMATHLRAELVLAALDMALGQRRPRGVIHHSDQGSQYTSVEFGNRCTSAGVRPSMGSVGDCYDNALCESFFATLECELLDRRKFKTPTEARLAVFEFIEGWYNPWRRHSALGYLSPAAFERLALEKNPQDAVENAPSSPGTPITPAGGLPGYGRLPSPNHRPGTLPQPLENASRFPQPAGPYGDGPRRREERKR